jgi:hypothetical protein
MANYGEKAERVLKFLFGLRNARVTAALARYGFTDDDRDEGWERLRTLGRGKIGVTGIDGSEIGVLQSLDAWENHWFPIAYTSLQVRHPAVHQLLFLNLSQTEGPEVAVSVGLLLERLEEMSDQDGPYGAEGPKARQLLTKRGLTPAVLAEARGLISALGKSESKPARSFEEEQAYLERAEKAMWDWYLEWSQIARIAIKSRPLLRLLGFLKAERGTSEEPAVPGEPVDDPGATKPAAE